MQQALRLINKYLYLTGILTMLVISSCHETDPKIEIESTPAHTLLIYMAGDNSLSEYCTPNIKSCISGLLQSRNPINLVIFKDNKVAGQSMPVLFQLKPSDNRSRVDTIFLEHFLTEKNSADPNFMAHIINKTFQKFNSPIKGVEFWSHGMSWIPNRDYTIDGSRTRTDGPDDGILLTRAQNYFGQDQGFNSYMQLWDFPVALKQCPHLNYVSFDACYMSTVEVAHQLAPYTDYILAAPTEIMGEGFPYSNMIQSLSYAKDATSLENALDMCFDDFFYKYETNGTFSLIRTAHMDELALAFKQLLQEHADRIKKVETSKRLDLRITDEQLQHYGRNRVSTRYYFYDMADWVRYIAKGRVLSLEGLPMDVSDDAPAAKVIDLLEKSVMRSYFSPKFTDGYEDLAIARNCGLAISVPELFQYISMAGISYEVSPDKLQAAYPLTSWYQATH